MDRGVKPDLDRLRVHLISTPVESFTCHVYTFTSVHGNEVYFNCNVAKCKSSHVNRRCKTSNLNLSEMQQKDVLSIT